MTSQPRTPDLTPVEIRQAVIKHTYDCPTCKSIDRICAKGRRLRRTLKAGGEPAMRRVNGGPG
ncbi:hypothetical protein ABZ366_07400 [Streptomyces sp. NPDC005904]|uniref:hypothetical protein n=1 Tax=Streptomyces sp. NPDC005904 TaxID=3154570 RepID=UPI0033CE5F79